MSSDSQLLFVLHGSPEPAYAEAAASFMQAWQRHTSDTPAMLCFLEHQAPKFADLMQQIETGACIVPLFLNRGGHVRRDIPHLVAGHNGVQVTEPLVDAYAIAEVLLARLAELSHNSDYLLLYSHGSREDTQTVTQLAETLRTHQPLPVDVVLAADGEAGLAKALARAATLDAAAPAILPHFLFGGRWQQRLAQQLEAVVESHPFERVEIAAPLGEHPAMFALIERRIGQCRD